MATEPIDYVSCAECSHDIDEHHAEPIGCRKCQCRRFQVRAFIKRTRSEVLNRWEQNGWLDPDCSGCWEFYQAPLMPYDVHAPRHEAKERCESGKGHHCTCEVCW